MDSDSRGVVNIVHGNNATLYDVLKVSRNATGKEIEEAYSRQLALQNGLINVSSKTSMSKVSKNFLLLRKDALDIAYNTLRDSEKKANYEIQRAKGFDAVPIAPNAKVIQFVGKDIPGDIRLVNWATYGGAPYVSCESDQADDDFSICTEGNSVFDFDDDANNDKQTPAVVTPTSTSSGKKSHTFNWVNSVKIKVEEKKKKASDGLTKVVVTPTSAAESLAKKSLPTDVIPTYSSTLNLSSEAMSAMLDLDEGSVDISDISHLSGIASSPLEKQIDDFVKYIVFKTRCDPSILRCGNVRRKPRNPTRQNKRDSEKTSTHERRSKEEMIASNRKSSYVDDTSDDNETSIDYSDDESVSTLASVSPADFCFTCGDAEDACNQMLHSIVDLPSAISELLYDCCPGKSLIKQEV